MALTIALIVFVSVFVNSAAGFGIALVAMPLLVAALGLEVARPLVALFAAINSTVMLVYYREALNLKAVWPLIVASLVGIPLGELGLRTIDERIVTTGLGLLIIGYAVYSLVSPAIPEIKHRIWTWVAGFTSGILTGAYNTGGPPLVIYGTARRWGPDEFKGNLQGAGWLKGLAVVGTHFVSGNVTPEVWQGLLISLPAVVVGVVAGFAVGDRLKPEVFRRVVLFLLIILGVRLLF